jgi:hypothetical protein
MARTVDRSDLINPPEPWPGPEPVPIPTEPPPNEPVPE